MFYQKKLDSLNLQVVVRTDLVPRALVVVVSVTVFEIVTSFVGVTTLALESLSARDVSGARVVVIPFVTSTGLFGTWLYGHNEFCIEKVTRKKTVMCSYREQKISPIMLKFPYTRSLHLQRTHIFQK